MAAHNELGKIGEKYAQQYLVSKGYTIRHTNWKAGKYELDIVAEKDNLLIVAEVKTRSSEFFGRPEEFVTDAKIRRTTDAADHYMRHHNILTDIRYDIISILKTPEGNYKIEHIEDAFLPIPFYY
jgi:putative endonuclease